VLGQGRYRGGDVLAPPTLANDLDQVAGDDIDHAVHDPMAVPPTDDDLGLLPTRCPRCPQGWELSQDGFIPEQDAPPGRQDRCRTLGDRPLFSS